MKIKSYLPVFQGFYGTWFEYDNEEQDIEVYNEDNNTDLSYEHFKFDYADYHNRVSKSCVSSIWNNLKLDGFSIGIDFDSLYSPREYNFSNDVIWVTYDVSKEDFKRLKKYCFIENKKDFQTFLTNNYASRSGFSSFVEDNIDDWANVYMNGDNEYFARCFGALLKFYFENEGYVAANLLSDISCENYINYEKL